MRTAFWPEIRQLGAECAEPYDLEKGSVPVLAVSLILKWRRPPYLCVSLNTRSGANNSLGKRRSVLV
jgi:hypothetical protein